MDLPLALSVHKFVSSVGAYAGFASIIGLAILVLLFFAQARETNALRDHVDELLDRIAGLEGRVSRQAAAATQAATSQAASQASAASAPSAAPVQAASAASELAALELAPFAPAGVGAPALSAATRVIPAGVAVGAGARRAAAAPPPQPVAAAARSPQPVAAAPVQAPGTNGSSSPVAARTFAGETAGRSRATANPGLTGPRPATAPGGGRLAPGGVASPGRGGAATSAGRRPAQRAVAPVRGAGSARSRWPRIVGVGAAVALVAAAVAVAVALLTSGSHKSATTASTTRAPSATTRAATVNPRTVTVAVLNGTPTAGLAHRTALRLAGDGFQEGKVTTASDQTRTATTVAYIPGARAQALAVAKALKLGAGSVTLVDSGTRAVACEGMATCTASVFVTIGADLAKQ